MFTLILTEAFTLLEIISADIAVVGVATLLGAVILAYSYFYTRWAKKRAKLDRTIKEIEKLATAIQSTHRSRVDKE